MKNLKANIKELWKGSKWHSLAFLFTLPYGYLINRYNIMQLREAMWNQISGSQYFFQLAICFGLCYIVGWSVEVKQIRPGNNTEPLWIKYARPDIWMVVVTGCIGCILGILTYIFIIN